MFRPEPSVSESCRRDWERYLYDEGVPAFSLYAGPRVKRDTARGARRVLQVLRDVLWARADRAWQTIRTIQQGSAAK